MYVERVSAEDVLQLAADCLLFGKFCDASICNVPVNLTLTETLPCTGGECTRESVGSFNFRYVHDCLHAPQKTLHNDSHSRVSHKVEVQGYSERL